MLGWRPIKYYWSRILQAFRGGGNNHASGDGWCKHHLKRCLIVPVFPCWYKEMIENLNYSSGCWLIEFNFSIKKWIISPPVFFLGSKTDRKRENRHEMQLSSNFFPVMLDLPVIPSGKLIFYFPAGFTPSRKILFPIMLDWASITYNDDDS